MAGFWSIIDQARGGISPQTPSASPNAVAKVLATLSTEDVQEFLREFTRKLIELNRWDLWGAGYVIAGGMSDDSFHYFRSWVIGKGKDCFEAAMKDPATLAAFVDDREVDNELLEYVALKVLESRGINTDPRDDIEASPDDEPSGEPFDEETIEGRYPGLAAWG